MVYFEIFYPHIPLPHQNLMAGHKQKNTQLYDPFLASHFTGIHNKVCPPPQASIPMQTVLTHFQLTITKTPQSPSLEMTLLHFLRNLPFCCR